MTVLKQTDLGILLLRLFAGARLLYGVVDNIISRGQMQEFGSFLQSFHFPWPYGSAVVSVYAQALAGILYLIGWKVRIAAALMTVNFIIALVMVHRNGTVEEMTPALSLLFISLFLLLAGGGKYGVDGRK
ncbi:MAG TPA: DoxX family protein [Chitinophagaceae bacterium]|jgi:putative oxidoreductase|nr:DoxX family protein [Chitinophagaceae bacterium]